MELKDRVKRARKHAGLTQVELADAIGIKQASISEIERGLSRTSAYLVQIAQACGVSPVWLATGDGEMIGDGSLSLERENRPSHDDFLANLRIDNGVLVNNEIPLVPLISWVAAGAWHEVVDPYAVGTGEEWMLCPVPHGPRTYALRVRGESNFNPYGKRSFSDGDIVFVDPDKTPVNGSMVIVRLTADSEATFKELVYGDLGRQYLRPLNPAWPDPVIEVNQDADFCGVVIAKLVTV